MQICVGSARIKSPLTNNHAIWSSCDDIEYAGDTESDRNSMSTARDEGCENVHTLLDRLSDQGTLCPDHVLQYLDSGSLQLSQEESLVAQFLARMSSGMGTSTNKMEGMLDFMHLMNPNCTMPKSVDKFWEVIENAHARMIAPLKRRSVTVPIPENVQALLFEPMESITWNFWNPCEILIRMVTMGPLSSKPNAFALFPLESNHLDDFCHGEKMKRILESLPKDTSALSAILFSMRSTVIKKDSLQVKS
jgi:hypothetical protein